MNAHANFEMYGMKKDFSIIDGEPYRVVICGVCSSSLLVDGCYYCSSPVVWDDFSEDGEVENSG